MEESKKHYKMYKSGKHWVTAAVITVAAQACLLVPHTVHADAVKQSSNVHSQAAVINTTKQTSDSQATKQASHQLTSATTSQASSANASQANAASQTSHHSMVSAVSASNTISAISSQVSQAHSSVNTKPNSAVTSETVSAVTSQVTSTNASQASAASQTSYHSTGSVSPSDSASAVSQATSATSSQTSQSASVATSNAVSMASQAVKAAVTTVNKPEKKQINGKWYLYDNNKMLTGYQTIDGTGYYFDPHDGAMVTNKFVWLPVEPNDQYGMAYFDNDGHMIKGQTYELGGHQYYFNQYGAYATGLTMVNGQEYYYDPEKGWMVTNKFVWLPVEPNNQYGMTYFDNNGHMVKNGKYQVGDHWYYFDQYGAYLTGLQKVNGQSYYFDPQTGWMAQNKFVWLPVEPNNQYGMTYFDNNGQMYKNGKYNIGGHWYLFDQYGAYLTGWQKQHGYWYYGDPQTGWLKTGQLQNNGCWYLFDANNAVMLTGFQQVPGQNKTCYYNASGAMVYGQQYINGHWYLFDQNTGAMQTGWQTVYDGSLHRNKDVWYNAQGQMAHGLTEVSNHVYCYFDPNSGELLRSSMKNINGNTYYFEQDGAMVTNKFVWLPVEPNNQYGMTYFDNNGHMVKNGKYQVGDHWYYFDQYGAYLTGLQKVNGQSYYFDPQTGWMAQNKFVWLPVEPNNQYGMTYFDNNGQMIKNRSCEIGGHWYVFDQYGAYLTGWHNWHGQRYYFNDNGQLARNQFVWLPVEPNNQYGMTYFDNNGQMYKNGKYNIGGHWYLFDQYGAYLTGWQNTNGQKYYYDNNGWMATGMTNINGHTYLFNNNGVMQTGWQQLGWHEYFFNRDTGAMNTGWSWADDQWLHFDNNGVFDGFNERVLEWFYDRIGHLTYSMSGSRNGSDGTADCSGSMTQAIADAGGARPAYLYNTETLHNYLLASGYHLVTENGSFTPQWGDVIIWGKRGSSSGAAGHTLVITNDGPNANCISTCYYTNGQAGTAVQVLNYNYYWHLAGCPYYYVYRQGNKYRS